MYFSTNWPASSHYMYSSGQQSFHSSSTPLGPFFRIGTKKIKNKRVLNNFWGELENFVLYRTKKEKGTSLFLQFLEPLVQEIDHCFEFGLKKEKKKKVLRNFCGELKSFARFRTKKEKESSLFYNFLTPVQFWQIEPCA